MGYQDIGINLSTKPSHAVVKLATVFIFLMFAKLDWAIHCRCKHSLIPLIIERDSFVTYADKLMDTVLFVFSVVWPLLSCLHFMLDLLGGH